MTLHHLIPANDLEEALTAARKEYWDAYEEWCFRRSKDASYRMDAAKAREHEIIRQMEYRGMRDA